jgi:hypothetical protein
MNEKCTFQYFFLHFFKWVDKKYYKLRILLRFTLYVIFKTLEKIVFRVLLWIQIRSGSGCHDFVDPDPYPDPD